MVLLPFLYEKIRYEDREVSPVMAGTSHAWAGDS